MAKKQAVFEIDSFVDSALQAAVSKAGKERCYVAAAHESTQLVLPVPSLALRWLIQSNGWPIGRVTQSGGKFGTQKSSFIFQLISWYLQEGGFAVLIDTEWKTSASLLKSMLPSEYFDMENPAHKRFIMLNATTVNEWQQHLTEQRKLLVETAERMKVKPNFPIFYAVDSMMGAGSEEAMAYIQKEGEAQGRCFSDEPLLINRFMKSFPDMLLGWPITLHMSHHEKPGINTPGSTRQGGHAPDFYATLDIQFKRGGVTHLGRSLEFDNKAFQGKAITMELRKSSMGSDVGKVITVPFCWRFENGRQISWWDWTGTTAGLLLDHTKELKDIMDINKKSMERGQDKYWSEAMGMKDSDAMPATMFGELVEKHELRPAIETALNIQQHPDFRSVTGEV